MALKRYHIVIGKGGCTVYGGSPKVAVYKAFEQMARRELPSGGSYYEKDDQIAIDTTLWISCTRLQNLVGEPE